MRHPIASTILAAALALAPLAAFAQASPNSNGPAVTGGQSGGGGGPMVGQTGAQSGTTIPTDKRTEPAQGAGSTGSDASIGGIGSGANGAGTGTGSGGASGGGGAPR